MFPLLYTPSFVDVVFLLILQGMFVLLQVFLKQSRGMTAGPEVRTRCVSPRLFMGAASACWCPSVRKHPDLPSHEEEAKS